MPNALVCTGGMLECTFGMIPSIINSLPTSRVLINGRPVSTTMDHLPEVNIISFGMCISETNPEVIAATAAALGVPTPAPCVPAILAPWLPVQPEITTGGLSILAQSSVAECMWEGVIEVIEPSQVQVVCG